MKTTHRQTGYSAPLARRDSAEIGINKIYDLMEILLIYPIHGVGEVKLRLGAKTKCIITRGSISRHIAIGSNYDHLLRHSGRNQIVEDPIGMSLSHPGSFIATHSMEEIEHRITAIRGFVSGRSVDHQTAIRVAKSGMIPHITKRAVRHILGFIKISDLTGNEADTRHRLHITDGVRIARIEDFDSIYDKLIAINIRRERGNGNVPDALIFIHF